MTLPTGTLVTVYQPNSVGYYDLTTVDVADLASVPSGSYIYAYASNGVGGFDFQQVLVSDIGDLPEGSEAWVREPNGVGWYDAALVATTELVSSYVGPLDIVPGAVVAYSQRAMVAGSTANAIRIAKGSGGPEQSFPLVDNAVDAAAVTAFLDGEDGLVAKWFNLGSLGATGDVVQATSANQPGWAAGSADFGENGLLATAADITFPAGPVSLLLVIEQANVVTGTTFAISNADGSFEPDLYFQAPQAVPAGTGLQGGDNTGTAVLIGTGGPNVVDGMPHVLFVSIAAGGVYASADGVALNTSFSTAADIQELVARVMLGDDTLDRSDLPYTGKIPELVIWAGDKSASAAALVANAMAYYQP